MVSFHRKFDCDKRSNVWRLIYDQILWENNDLRTEEGRITVTGYVVMTLSSVFGFCVFLMERTIYGKSLKKKWTD